MLPPNLASRFSCFPSRLSFAAILAALPLVAIVTAVVTAAAWFLWPAPFEFPMDDTYIHFVYAQNLAEQGKLMFNFPDEPGVGSTSLLWVALLAGGHFLGLSLKIVAKVLGVAALTAVGGGLYLLLRPLWHPLQASIAALLVVLSGHMLWFALSGMETMLFLALGILALLFYREERWVWLGLTLGLLPLVRPEGLALAVAIGLVELWRCKGPTRGLLVTGAICLLVCGPWFGYLWWRTGHLLPTSAVGKQISTAIGLNLVMQRNEVFAVLGRFPGLIYIGVWLLYLVEFVLGGMALPPPRISLGATVNNANYTLSLWAIMGLASVILPLLWAVSRRYCGWWQWPNRLKDRCRRPLLVFLTWLALHNLSYILFLPIPGTASRYGALNHVALWLTLAMGLFGSPHRPRWWWWLAGGLLVIAAANTIYWNKVYDANLDHMENVRIAAAHFVRDNFSADDRCAVFDVGAMRYYSQRPVVDLGGLIDPTYGQRALAGETDRYLVEHNVDCLILPGRAGTAEDGWFDFAAAMGVTDTPLFDLRPVTVFEIERERWLQGYLPTNNYQATVTVYELSAIDAPPRVSNLK